MAISWRKFAARDSLVLSQSSTRLFPVCAIHELETNYAEMHEWNAEFRATLNAINENLDFKM